MSNVNTFDTSNVREYYDTEIDLQSEYYDDYPEISLERLNTKSIPGTQPDDSLPFPKMDIATPY